MIGFASYSQARRGAGATASQRRFLGALVGVGLAVFATSSVICVALFLAAPL